MMDLTKGLLTAAVALVVIRIAASVLFKAAGL